MERTKERIVKAAVKMFDQYGIDNTTMEQISEEADVARGTLYNHFPSREAIISEYIEQSFVIKREARFQKLEDLSDTRERMIYIFNQLIKGVQNQKDLFEKFIVYRMQNMGSFQENEEGKSHFSQLGYKIIELGQENGEIRNDIPVYILEDLYEFSFLEAVKPLYMEPENYNLEESIEACVDLFLNGVAKVN